MMKQHWEKVSLYIHKLMIEIRILLDLVSLQVTSHSHIISQEKWELQLYSSSLLVTSVFINTLNNSHCHTYKEDWITPHLVLLRNMVLKQMMNMQKNKKRNNENIVFINLYKERHWIAIITINTCFCSKFSIICI